MLRGGCSVRQELPQPTRRWNRACGILRRTLPVGSASRRGDWWNAPCARALALAGLITGFLSGLLGVGGGFVIVPALRRTTDLPMHSIVSTSLMVVALVSTFAVLASAFTGHLDFIVAWPFALGALIGMIIGRIIAPKIAAATLQTGFAGLSGVVAIGLVAKTLLSLRV